MQASIVLANIYKLSRLTLAAVVQMMELKLGLSSFRHEPASDKATTTTPIQIGAGLNKHLQFVAPKLRADCSPSLCLRALLCLVAAQFQFQFRLRQQ